MAGAIASATCCRPWAYPIQVTVGSPRRLWDAGSELFRTRDSLRQENATLQAHERELTLRTATFEALEQENARLRALTGNLPPLVTKSVLADVVNADLGNLRQRFVINQGDHAKLFRSQSVVDATGVVGQLVRVGPWSAEVMLITDPGAAGAGADRAQRPAQHRRRLRRLERT